jgi:exoribonuclease R
MRDSSRRAHQYENAILDLVEAGVLSDDVGTTFRAVVVEVDDKDRSRGSVTIAEPAIDAHVRSADGSDLPLGHEVEVTLTKADVGERKIELTLG